MSRLDWFAGLFHETREQGSRDPDYKLRRWEFKERMAVLNTRGAT